MRAFLLALEIVPPLGVGMHHVTLCVTTFKRTQSVQSGVPMQSMGTITLSHAVAAAAGTSTALNPSFIRLASRTKLREAWNRNSMVKNNATGIRYMASCKPTAL